MGLQERKKRKIIDFKPQDLDDYDFRFDAAKRIRRFYQDLKRQCDITTAAKDSLARRAAYLSVKIETLEVESLTSRNKVKESALLQAINCFVGILKQLGLEDLSETGRGKSLKERIEERFDHKQRRLKAEKSSRKRQRLAKVRNSSRPQPLAIAE